MFRLDQLRLQNIEQVIGGVGNEQVSDQLEPRYRAVTASFASSAALGLGYSFSMINPRVLDFIADFAGNRIRSIDATSRRRLRLELAEAVRRGEGIPLIKKRVERALLGGVTKSRAKVIARTEVHRAANFARHEALEQSGLRLNRKWLHTKDSRTRDAHRMLGGKIVGHGEVFEFEGATAEYPGGFGVPRLDINCRCVIVPTQEQKTDADEQQFWRNLDVESARFEIAVRQGLERQLNNVMARIERL